MSSCSEGAFGGDFEVGNTELVEMAGTWCCTVEVNDPYYTTQYYLSDYSAEFLNSYFGDPYGYYNPDANGDGDIDIADAVHIVNYVVGKINALAPKFEYTLPEPQ